VVSAEEAQRLIDAVMDSANYIPASEMIPLPQADESLRAMLAVTERLEQKINLIIRHEGTRLPAALDPGVLSAEVKELAGKNQKIEAVALHRRNTAATLAETCELIQRHLERKQESH
jgi:hypothetical protein